MSRQPQSKVRIEFSPDRATMVLYGDSSKCQKVADTFKNCPKTIIINP